MGSPSAEKGPGGSRLGGRNLGAEKEILERACSGAFSPLPSPVPPPPRLSNSSCSLLFLISQLTRCLKTGSLGKYLLPPPPAPRTLLQDSEEKVAVSGAKGPVPGSRAGEGTSRWWRTLLEEYSLWD